MDKKEEKFPPLNCKKKKENQNNDISTLKIEIRRLFHDGYS